MLEVTDLYVSYYMDVFILKGISLNMKSNTITAVIGPNGAGKSTLLRSIFGLIPKKRGKIIFNGYDITNEAPHRLFRMGMTYIPQHRSIFPWLTVHENLIMGAQDLDKNQLKAKLSGIYEQYPLLKNKKHNLAMSLSGGQQRLLEFARAMLREPKIMLIDEPTTGLDPRSTNIVYNEISRLKDKNIAVLLVEQNVRRAVEICDFLVVMKDGQILIQNDKEKIEDQIVDIVKDWLV